MREKIKPYVNKYLQPFLNRIKGKEEVIGIVLLGALGTRNSIDMYSDLDLSVFLKKKNDTNLDWLPVFDFNLYTPTSGNKLKALNFNVRQKFIDKEREEKWDEGKKEAYSKCKIIYDRNGDIHKLIQSKIKYSESERNKRLIELLSSFPPYIDINPVKQARRKLIQNSHHILNQGIDLLLEALFVFNRQYMPHIKWRIGASLKLKWIPNGYSKNLREALLIKAHTKSDIERRILYLKLISVPLIEEIHKHIKLSCDPYMYACVHYWNRQLTEKPFSIIITDFLRAQKNIDLSEIELQYIFGKANYHLVSNSSDFIRVLNSDSMFRKYLGEEQSRRIEESLLKKEF